MKALEEKQKAIVKKLDKKDSLKAGIYWAGIIEGNVI